MLSNALGVNLLTVGAIHADWARNPGFDEYLLYSCVKGLCAGPPRNRPAGPTVAEHHRRRRNSTPMQLRRRCNCGAAHH
jgi:hypothetical protein